MLLVFFPIVAHAEVKYELSGKQYIERFEGRWNGKLVFRKVYCMTFPSPNKVHELQQAMFNNKSIYQIDAFYENNLFLSVVSSTIPPSQTAEEAMPKVLANERRNEDETKAQGLSYTVSDLTTSFGPTVGVIVRNPGPGNSYGPFPLTRSFMGNASSPLLSMSVHRIFTRGHDRFEVAAIQLAPKPVTTTTEEEMATFLTSFTEQAVTSLQECTVTMPPRIPTDQ